MARRILMCGALAVTVFLSSPALGDRTARTGNTSMA